MTMITIKNRKDLEKILKKIPELFFLARDKPDLLSTIETLFEKGFIIFLENKNMDNPQFIENISLFVIRKQTTRNDYLKYRVDLLFSREKITQKEANELLNEFNNQLYSKDTSNKKYKIEFLISEKHEALIEMLSKEHYSPIEWRFEKTLPKPSNFTDISELLFSTISDDIINEVFIVFHSKNGNKRIIPLKQVSTKLVSNYERPILLFTKIKDPVKALEFKKNTMKYIKWDEIKVLFSKNLSYTSSSFS